MKAMSRQTNLLVHLYNSPYKEPENKDTGPSAPHPCFRVLHGAELRNIS